MVQKSDSFWLREQFKEKHDHSNPPGLKFSVILTGNLCDEVLNRMVHYALSTTSTAGQVAQITYHRFNQNSAIQENDDLNEQQHEDNQITIIIPFTNLDVHIETNTTTAKEMVHLEMVLCYIKSHTCLLIKKGQTV